ncbi:hypothetical protein ACN6LC_006205 [Streptomyces violaceoruber]|uniref:hypothetical protein n=1 Tax=Streptomyces violaceoruber TaxID=1935 RepID=UPI00403D110E
MDHLHHVVHHQNTLYTATVPAALYAAAILLDPRTARSVDKGPHDLPGPLRAELLGWLNSVADAADDQTEAELRRFGFPPEDHPPFVRTREIRPLLFSAVSACFDDHDPHAREAALAACVPLLDDTELRHHRTAMVPLLRETLAVGALWQYQERDLDALSARGEDTTGLDIRRNPFTVCDTPLNPSAAEWHFSSEDRAELPF